MERNFRSIFEMESKKCIIAHAKTSNSSMCQNTLTFASCLEECICSPNKIIKP